MRRENEQNKGKCFQHCLTAKSDSTILLCYFPPAARDFYLSSSSCAVHPEKGWLQPEPLPRTLPPCFIFIGISISCEVSVIDHCSLKTFISSIKVNKLVEQWFSTFFALCPLFTICQNVIFLFHSTLQDHLTQKCFPDKM